MALINKDGHYIKLDKGGEFEIYPNEEARLQAKRSTSPQVILKKYLEIISDLYSPKYDELHYYGNGEFEKLFGGWMREYQRYQSNYCNHIVGEEYPLMAEYYPDVATSIPQILVAGTVGNYDPKSAEDAYVQAKKDKSWGETIDA